MRVNNVIRNSVDGIDSFFDSSVGEQLLSLFSISLDFLTDFNDGLFGFNFLKELFQKFSSIFSITGISGLGKEFLLSFNRGNACIKGIDVSTGICGSMG